MSQYAVSAALGLAVWLILTILEHNQEEDKK